MKDGQKVVKTVAAKTKYSHATAGDIVQVTINERKNVQGGTYTCRVKTPTKTGVEVVINGHRICVKQNLVKFLHRCDGFDYKFTPIDSELLRYFAF